MIPLHVYIWGGIILTVWGIIFTAYCFVSVKLKKHKKSKKSKIIKSDVSKSEISKVDTKKTPK